MMHKESLRPKGDIGHVAILVIDMQADFVGPSAAIPCKGAEACIPHINKLLQAARSQGIPIIFTQEAHRSSGIDFGRELDYGEPKHCLEGSPGVRLIDLVTREPGDHLVIKRRYSAFFATDLEILLRGLRVDTLILTGVATDVCVRATAQDAQQHDYHVIVPRECVAGTSVAAHDGALANISYVFGRVIETEGVLALLNAKKSLSREQFALC